MTGIKARLTYYLNEGISPLSLAIFRIAFGVLMLFSGIRFLLKGWLYEFYIQPDFFFKYYGFEWISPLPEFWMYVLYAAMLLAALGICLGYYYRLSTLVFFIGFNYFELLDKTYYLNHYYLISLISLWLIFIPANSYLSLDSWRKNSTANSIPRYFVTVLQLQLAIVYLYAGLAKVSSDWLIEAMPMAIWLKQFNPASTLGQLMHHPYTAYIFSWAGCIYDCCIVFFLLMPKTRIWAYVAVVIFHVATWLLFPIGVFPFVMIALTLIFFSPEELKKGLQKLHIALPAFTNFAAPKKNWVLKTAFATFLVFQLGFPLRSWIYPGDVLWHEQGFNFSWRVMRVEKSGIATFYVKDADSQKQTEVYNPDFLTPLQEKMMVHQADFILQYARFLAEIAPSYYGIKNPEVYADIFVSQNAGPMQRFIDANAELSKKTDSWKSKNWILAKNHE